VDSVLEEESLAEEKSTLGRLGEQSLRAT
jgi:hypothetical protein